MLKAQRDNFDALHLLGVLKVQRGQPDEAHRLITAALKVDPRSADALSNLALVLHSLKRSDEALASVDKALALAPGHSTRSTIAATCCSISRGRPKPSRPSTRCWRRSRASSRR